jgi:hypothetical protein
MDAAAWLLLKETLMVVTIAWAFITCLRIPHRTGTLYAPLAWLLGLALLVESVGTWMSYHGRNNGFIYNFYMLLEYSMLLWIIWRYRPAWRAPLQLAWLIGSGTWLGNLLLRGDMAFFFTATYVVMCFLLAGCCLLLLWHLADRSTRPLHQVPEFWLFLGLMLYTGAMAPLIGPLEQLYGTYPDLTRNLYVIISVLGYQRYVLAAVACMLVRREQIRWGIHER